MKKLLVLALIAVLGIGCGAARSLVGAAENTHVPEGAATAAPGGEGWTNLFASEVAGKWINVSNATPVEDVFELNEGVFHIFGKHETTYIAFDGDTFGDFELHIEYKVADGTNSGVFFRSAKEDPVYKGFEIQVLEDHGEAPSKNSAGALYDVTTPMYNLSRPAGEWNSFDITAQGGHLVVVMNGWKVVDTDISQMTMPIGKFPTPLATLPQTGHIILQDHGGEVWFKNLLVKKL
ncbi:MAG: DUF1080 domain-containing protein [Candidatus Hydrogenedentes bacterium]|nr:DUF1080 domain-containing protein [Candidatus Hydrogenedentota bacterium]